MMRCAKGVFLALLALTIAACGIGPKRAPAPDEGEVVQPAEPVDQSQDPSEDQAEASPEQRYAEGLDYLRSGRGDAARRAFSELMQELPEASGPPTNLGILAARDAKHEEARTLFEEAIRRNPDNLVARNWLAHSYRESRRPEDAERVWLRALERAPDYTAAHINLGRLYENVLADLPAAVRHYRAAYESSDGEALRVLPWIAQLEERLQQRQPNADAPSGNAAQNSEASNATQQEAP